MINKRSYTLSLIIAAGFIVALLVGLTAAGGRGATAQASDAPTPTPPREILVNGQCGVGHEHIRFGHESSHYYRFWAKSGYWYQISTTIFPNDQGIAVDTRLLLYRHNPATHPGEPPLAENDDYIPPPSEHTPDPHSLYASRINYIAPEDGYYWIEVQNRIEGGEGSYCVKVELKQRQDHWVDACEPNDSFETACEVRLEGERVVPGSIAPAGSPTNTYNFASPFGFGPDQDYYKLWVKQGHEYTCSTKELSQLNDTTMRLYDHHRVELAYDNNPTKRESEVTAAVDYTGWLYIWVAPVIEINYEYAYLYDYKLECKEEEAQPTPTPTTPPPPPSAPLPAAAPPTVTPTPTVTPPPAPPGHPWDATRTPGSDAWLPGAVSFTALPRQTPTPTTAPAGQTVAFTVQIYYDKNDNQIKDEDEGVANMPVYIYTGLSPEPLAFTTTAGGLLLANIETANDSVRLVIPYLGLNQQISVAGVQEIRLRIAP